MYAIAFDIYAPANPVRLYVGSIETLRSSPERHAPFTGVDRITACASTPDGARVWSSRAEAKQIASRLCAEQIRNLGVRPIVVRVTPPHRLTR